MSSFGNYLPIPIVATLLALIYGLSIHRAWISALLTLCLVVLGGCICGLLGQFIGVILSALVIFIAFTRPEEKRKAHEAARRAHEVKHLPNEEDI